jgi:hypothetical protein
VHRFPRFRNNGRNPRLSSDLHGNEKTKLTGEAGENDRAISILTQLLQTPYGGWLYIAAPVTPAFLRLDPLWDPLRSDPAFQKLCEEKQP